ncbi:hypothetical protein HY641_02885 [Candidatus Woesearchaeota archaeon]|nr:hypothetical protein [Candidatus Woesearchaeota archaeon]
MIHPGTRVLNDHSIESTQYRLHTREPIAWGLLFCYARASKRMYGNVGNHYQGSRGEGFRS